MKLFDKSKILFFKTYKYSGLATFFSMIGSIMFIFGVLGFLLGMKYSSKTDENSGLLIIGSTIVIALSFVLIISAKFIGDRKAKKYADAQLTELYKTALIKNIEGPQISKEYNSSVYNVELNIGYGWDIIIRCVRNLAILDLDLEYVAGGAVGCEPTNLETLKITEEYGALYIGASSRNHSDTLADKLMIRFYNQTNVIQVLLKDVLDDKTDAVKDYVETTVKFAFLTNTNVLKIIEPYL